MATIACPCWSCMSFIPCMVPFSLHYRLELHHCIYLREHSTKQHQIFAVFLNFNTALFKPVTKNFSLYEALQSLPNCGRAQGASCRINYILILRVYSSEKGGQANTGPLATARPYTGSR